MAARECRPSTTSTRIASAIMGDSSGGWTTAMAALTGDAPELEGTVGTAVCPAGPGRRRVLSADQLPHDGCVGRAEVHSAGLP